MLKWNAQAWMMILAAVLMAGGLPAAAQDEPVPEAEFGEPLSGELPRTDAPPPVGVVSDARPEPTPVEAPPEPEPTPAPYEPTEDPGIIDLTFNREGADDPLTQDAMSKLDTMVESLEFANADLRNVIRIIGERLDINFIFDEDEVQGKITFRMRNVRLRDALESILTTRKLAIIADPSGIFRIVPQARVGRQEIETRTEVIQLNWLSATDLAQTMVSFLSPEVGKLEPNEESNTLIITDVPPQIEVIRELVEQLDIAERQVVIEARLIDVTVDAARELGTDWTVNDFDNINGDTPRQDPLVDMLSFSSGAGALELGQMVHIFGHDANLSAMFRFLERDRIIEILANPRVTTLNNVQARIDILEQIPYRNIEQGAERDIGRIEWEQAGVIITVRPIITPNGFVRMEIDLEQRINAGRVGTDPFGLAPPQIDQRKAQTNVIVRDGSTVVLGGLRQLQHQETNNAVPWMHRIPLLGWLFKNKNNNQTKNELVLMVTPIIVENEIALTDREKCYYDEIDKDWNLPDYFFDDVKQDAY